MEEKASRPNILLITDDQRRFDSFGFADGFPVRTPALDRLREGGALLSNVYSSCPICTPTRFTWYHGLYASQGHQGLLTNSGAWPKGLPKLPQLLKDQGYQTALVGKVHHGNHDSDLTSDAAVREIKAMGFQHAWETCGRSRAFRTDCHWTKHLEKEGLLKTYREDIESRRAHFCWNEPYRASVLDTPHQVDTLTTNEAIRWLDEDRKAEDPFFLHVSYCAPHFPLDAPQEYFDRVSPADMPSPIGCTDSSEAKYWKEQRAAYCALIEYLDGQMDRLLQKVDALDLTKDTLIVYTTDHGDLIGDHGSWHKGKPQDASCRTPTIVHLPGRISAGATCEGLFGAVDLPLSLLRAAGVTTPEMEIFSDTPAVSWWKHATGEEDKGRDFTYSETGNWRMIVSKDWKYVRYHNGRETLMHRGNDPQEQENLADSEDGREVLQVHRLMLLDESRKCVAPNPAGFYARRAAKKAESQLKRKTTSRIPLSPSSLIWD